MFVFILFAFQFFKPINKL